MTIEELRQDSSWACVFADAGNYSSGCSKGRSAHGCSPDPEPTRDKVVEILASRNGENDELTWVGVFRLDDGRFLFAEGSCDYTGWG